MRVRLTMVALPVLVALGLGACTGDDPDGVATADGDTPVQEGPSASADDVLAQELEFIACMRDEGVEMVDPIPGDTSGRSALIYEIDVNGKGSDPAFQAALEKCSEFLPAPPPAEPVTDDELAALQAYAQCMRDNGIEDYPDPEPDGELNYWHLEGDPVADAAAEACAHILPPDPSEGPSPAPVDE